MVCHSIDPIAQFFPPPKPTSAPDFAGLPPQAPLEWPPPSDEEIRDSFFAAAPNKAPGASGITFRLIRWIWAVASDVSPLDLAG